MDGRRFLDAVLSGLGLILLAPVFALIAAVVRLTSPGPAIYRSLRVGQYGRLFTLYKFRSMRLGAEHLGPGVTARGDPRVTSIGRQLRRYKLDELPQLANVLKGDMTLVGPRPEDPRYVESFTREHRRILEAKPGLTGPASLRFRNEEDLLEAQDVEKSYLEQHLPLKLQIELEYLERRTLASDMGVIWRTALALLRPVAGPRDETADS